MFSIWRQTKVGVGGVLESRISIRFPTIETVPKLPVLPTIGSIVGLSGYVMLISCSYSKHKSWINGLLRKDWSMLESPKYRTNGMYVLYANSQVNTSLSSAKALKDTSSYFLYKFVSCGLEPFLTNGVDIK